ncbi:unnamed protein product [Cuscuta campestris]|uniref:Uncharacterized protein n=1 Tax=Cuscuta campestris TaxID=132261 RepID=A0A484NC34_9ASTE|nr:unnamed protein product [Cuscuta campestris]
MSNKFPASFPQNPPSESSVHPRTRTSPRVLRRVPDWADAIKETRMQQKRRLYKHGDWVLHRSSLRHLSTVLSSRVILSLVPPVTWPPRSRPTTPR